MSSWEGQLAHKGHEVFKGGGNHSRILLDTKPSNPVRNASLVLALDVPLTNDREGVHEVLALLRGETADGDDLLDRDTGNVSLVGLQRDGDTLVDEGLVGRLDPIDKKIGKQV